MAVINNLGGGSVNFTSLDNALNELDNVINGAYERASVLPFTFTGNTVTGYTGSDTNMVIPTSYSLGEPEETTVDGVLFTSEELTDLSHQLYSFDTVEFKDIESDYTKTYTDGTELENLPEDFPNGAYLTMGHFTDSMEAFDLGHIFDDFNKFPIVCNNMQLQNYTSYEDYVDSLPGIVSLTFNGTVTIQTYITGNDYVVTSIGDNAFENFTSLTSITIPNSVINIGNYAFNNCSGLTSIVIPDSVTTIGDNAFRGCNKLTSITIPNNVTSIGERAFMGCPSLTSITIPDGVTSIGYQAFEGCTSLTSITIPNNVTSIGESAFFDCRSLTSIIIPTSVSAIGRRVFVGCSGLTSITVLRTTPATIGDGVFDSTNNAPIYVPSQSVSTYKLATNWSAYASRIQAISN